MFSRLACLLGVACIVCVGRAADAPESLGEKVVAFCAKHKGERVGNGECSVLAEAALHATGARKRGKDFPKEGDYVWGKLVFLMEHTENGVQTTGDRADLLPGDIIQFHGAKLGTLSIAHHTAVIASVKNHGKLVKVYESNVGPKKLVQEGTYHLEQLKAGWVRIYRPVPK